MLKSFFASAAACSHGAKYGCGPPGISAILLSDADAETTNARDIATAAAEASETHFRRDFMDGFLPRLTLYPSGLSGRLLPRETSSNAYRVQYTFRGRPLLRSGKIGTRKDRRKSSGILPAVPG